MPPDIKSNRKQLSYERILDAAARAVRREGYAGVGVADVMKQAGLTHGGFYAHFASREALLAKAVEHAGQETTSVLLQRLADAPDHKVNPFRALVDLYLSDRHLASTENGCPIAALGSEMPRQPPEVQQASRQRLNAFVSVVRQALPADAAPDAALAVASTMVGALQLARVLGNNAQGKALLSASRKALIEQYDRGAAATGTA